MLKLVGLDGIDLAGQPLVFVAVNLEVAVVDVALEDVAVEVVRMPLAATCSTS